MPGLSTTTSSGDISMLRTAGTHTGALIVNADDWGRDRETTDRTLDCFQCGVLSSVSAMAFMADSERAAALARDQNIDTGLHLNFTSPFSAPRLSTHLLKHQERLSKYLLRNRFAQSVFNPRLICPFEYVVAAQCEEFARLYGREPKRIDGHHHMHLCANVLLCGLLPPKTVIRRNFSFQPGEKGFSNRLYRKLIDRLLSRNHLLTDFFFSIEPMDVPGRLQRICEMSRQHLVEVETHPIRAAEFEFLTSEKFRRLAGNGEIACHFDTLFSTVA